VGELYEMKPEGEEDKSKISVPKISLPKDDGSIRGIDEKLKVDHVTGTESLDIPIKTADGSLRTEDTKILIVEDEIIIAMDLKHRLENLGYCVLDIAVSGKDCIKKTGETKPDLILMDILLNGDIDGIETAKQISKIYNIPFIYLTGSQENTILERSKITKPLGYIQKPFNDIELHNSIQLALNID
jgi:two-component system, response regulator PdtaR